ncbi:MAG: hypothetical protein N2038_01670 [Geminicoccaceae bacterium]|nr:hypothetical protein [Geminicoccaceae bacterium]
MKPCVFVHTNHKQYIGALVSAYSMKRNSRSPDAFDVRLIEHATYKEFFDRYEGREYRRDGSTRRWLNDDLQSFTPLRFKPPELMGYQGRAVVVDPDVFAVQDVWELLSRDMQGKAIMCRMRGSGPFAHFASSVMLLDCAELRHWKMEEDFDKLFRMERDYKDWMNLEYEDKSTIGLFEPEWNDFDRLTPRTKMLHNTRRMTQPWKTGLPVDFVPAERSLIPGLALLKRARRKLFGEYAFLGRYKPHPDAKQEEYFFGLLRECLEKGIVDEALLKEHMARNHIRHDALALIERVPALPKAA